MKIRWFIVSFLFIVIIAGVLALFLIPAPKPAQTPIKYIKYLTDTTSTTTPLDDSIVVTSPLPNSIISTTTITITGKARGSWFFEAQFPVEVFGQNGEVLGNASAYAQSDWTTNNFVPFTATVDISPGINIETPGETLDIILRNDNPSGDPTKQKDFIIPVIFSKDYKIF